MSSTVLLRLKLAFLIIPSQRLSMSHYLILFTSKKSGYEDKSIFLPAVGTGVSSDLIRAGILGIYWSLNLRDEDSNISWGLEFNLDEKDAHMEKSLIQYYGRSVRPVSEY